MSHKRAYHAAAAGLWAMRKENLDVLLEIAARLPEERHSILQALEAERGEPLETAYTVTMRDGVATLPVRGPIFRYANLFTAFSGATSCARLARDFAAALNDPRVSAILLEVDSPGGEVTGIAEFANMVFEARKKKRIVARVGGMACSAGYWIAAAAEEIVIDPTALLGSIGVVSTYYDLSGAQKQAGIKEYTFRSSQSPNKNLPPSSNEGADAIQKILDDLAAVFVARVAEYRGVSEAMVLKDFGQGGVCVGQAALDAGLADRFGSEEEILAELAGRGGAKTYIAGKGDTQLASERKEEVIAGQKDKQPDGEEETEPLDDGEDVCPDCGQDPCECEDEDEKKMSTKTTPATATATPDASAELETLRAENARLKQQAEEAEAARQSETEKNAKLEADALRGRLTAKAANFEGNREAHIAHMEKLCGAFGEESAELTHYVTVCTAQAEQIRTGKLFGERGSSAGAAEGGAAQKLDALAAAIAKAEGLTNEQAFVAACERNPALYRQLRAA